MKTIAKAVGFTTEKGNSQPNIMDASAISFKKAVKGEYKARGVLHVNFDLVDAAGNTRHYWNDLSINEVHKCLTRPDLKAMPGTSEFPASRVETDLEGAQKVANWIKKNLVTLNTMIETGSLKIDYSVGEDTVGLNGEALTGFPRIQGLYVMDTKTAQALAEAWSSFEV